MFSIAEFYCGEISGMGGEMKEPEKDKYRAVFQRARLALAVSICSDVLGKEEELSRTGNVLHIFFLSSPLATWGELRFQHPEMKFRRTDA